MSIKALLLDLDDTLLLSDFDTFVSAYFRALVSKINHLLPTATFIEALNVATQAVWHNDGTRGTNAEVFAAEFFPRVGRTPDELMPIFDSFYTHEFEALRSYTEADPDARPLVELAFARGYQVAIATQPMFPLAAILARLRWANVGAETFAYDDIASYETMSACKPHPLFFHTLIERLGRAPQECLMVGDSLETDMPARQLGIKTFWVDRGGVRPTEIVWDARGSLADLIALIHTGGIDEL